MSELTPTQWDAIRERAAMFPAEAFHFVREGLAHTSQTVHGPDASDRPVAAAQPPAPAPLAPAVPDNRHVSGQQLCMGLRDLAIAKYGMLAHTVLRKWGIRRTDDFGVLVYAMIDRGELRSAANDDIEDFHGVYDFDEAFSNVCLN